MSDFEKLLRAVTAWAAAQPDVRAVALVGSRARGVASPDSDVDLVLLSRRPETLLNDLAWTGSFGTVMHWTREQWGLVRSIRVWFESGLEVEFGVTSIEWASATDEGTLRVLQSGIRVLLDRDALFAAEPGARSFPKRP